MVHSSQKRNPKMLDSVAWDCNMNEVAWSNSHACLRQVGEASLLIVTMQTVSIFRADSCIVRRKWSEDVWIFTCIYIYIIIAQIESSCTVSSADQKKYDCEKEDCGQWHNGSGDCDNYDRCGFCGGDEYGDDDYNDDLSRTETMIMIGD